MLVLQKLAGGVEWNNASEGEAHSAWLLSACYTYWYCHSLLLYSTTVHAVSYPLNSDMSGLWLFKFSFPFSFLLLQNMLHLSSQNSLIYNEESVSSSWASLGSVQPPLLRTTLYEISQSSWKVQKLAFSNLSALQVEHPFLTKAAFGSGRWKKL